MKIKLSDARLLPRKTKNLVWALEKNDEFEKRVFEIRKKLKIDIKKPPPDSDQKKYRLPTQKEFDRFGEIIKQASNLTEEFKLPYTWNVAIGDFLLTDKLELSVWEEIGLEFHSKLHSDHIKMIIGPNIISGQTDPALKIVIGSRIARNRLVDWINKYWHDIEICMDHLDLPKVENIRWRKLEMVKDIILMRQNKKTYGQIAEKINDKYKVACDEPYLRKLYSRYQKRAKNAFSQ